MKWKRWWYLLNNVMGKIARCSSPVHCQSLSSWSNLWCLLAWLALRHFPLYCVHGVCTEQNIGMSSRKERQLRQQASMANKPFVPSFLLKGENAFRVEWRRPNGQHPPFPCKEPNWGKLGGDKCRILHSSDSSEHAKARSKQTRNLEVFCKFLWLDDAKWHYF